MSDFIVSLIRTWVPLAVGYLIAWGVLPADLSESATLALAAIVTGAYYAIVRALERRWPVVGWLLGTAKAPTYT